MMSEQPEQEQQPDPEAGRIRSLDERFAAQDGKIEGLSGKLDKVLAAVTGGGSPKAETQTAGSVPPSDGGGGGLSVAEQVRRGVEEIEKRKQEKADEQAAKDADAAWRKGIEERLPEQKPTEPAPGRKARLQRWLVGGP